MNKEQHHSTQDPEHERREQSNSHGDHEHNHDDHGNHNGHSGHHAHMMADFKKRFWISLIATIPVLILSPMIQSFLGVRGVISFPGDTFISFIVSTFIF
ncbi:MAG TPA: hypothetical protein VKA34_03550, partial [Balneolales bacterium]|nr:hypothetical protein [Balneolales bacterium]